MISFWEKESFVHFDYIIIGSGITGLSTAISLAEANPKKKIMILERGILPTGASTKNAGFACYGSASEILSDIKRVGEAQALKLVELRKTGLDMLINRLGADAIGYEQNGGGEFIKEDENISSHDWELLNTQLKYIFGKDVFVENADKVKKEGFNLSGYKYFLENTVEGQIDTGKMMFHLIQLAQSKGIYIYTGCEVKEINYHESLVSVDVYNAFSKEIYTFKAPQIAVCTNAFIRHLLPQFDVKPGRGQVLITEPIAGLPFKGIYHFDEGYYYFRNVGNRVLFGGGRNLDFEGETTEKFEVTKEIQHSLEHHLRHTIIPGIKFHVAERWAGIMAFGEQKWPILERVNNHTVVAGRMNGMGVAIGSEIGRQAAELMMRE